MTKATLKVHTENILPIIKKWLYSDKDIFVRELVSNACDALNKYRILSEQDKLTANKQELRIDIAIDKDKKTLEFTDTGIGMTGEEVEKYIAQLAFSGAEEFVSKYKTQEEKDQIIGHFGLGFYSAYMVAEKVTINTLSYQEGAKAALWTCDGGVEYDLEEGSRSEQGTQITLFVDKDNEEFLEESRIRAILEQYCAFLPFPIYLNGEHINSSEPLWLKSASQCTDEEYLQFYRKLYPMEQDPIFWIHLSVDYPFHLKGILYFPKIHRRFDFNQNTIKLFCNRVFVSDNCKDLIPDYLMILKGAIDSPDIPLNVSRSYLQMDRTVRQLSSHISKKIADKLSSLYQTDKEKFIQSWPNIEIIIKLGILQDDKFYERAKEFLIWKNSRGEWTTIEEAKERAGSSQKIFYSADDKGGSHFLQLYKDKQIEVLFATSPVDSALINYLEGKLVPLKFQRIDGGIDDAILDTEKEKTLLDVDGKTEATRLAELVRSHLDNEHVKVEAKSLASDSLPGFIMMEEGMRRMRDYFTVSEQTLPPSISDKKTFVVNTNSKLVSAIPSLQQKDPQLAKDLVTQLYELSLLSQKELEPGKLADFIQRATSVLEKLVEHTKHTSA